MSARSRINRLAIQESVRVVEVRPDGTPFGGMPDRPLTRDGQLFKVNPLEGSPGLDRLPAKWDRAQVAKGIMRAFATLDMLPKARGPCGYRSSWPDYVWSFDDQVAQQSRSKEEALVERLARLRNWSRPKPKFCDVSKMERCFAWVSNLRASNFHRAEIRAVAVQSWSYWTFKRFSLQRCMRKRGLERKQFLRDVDAGLQWIADDLNKRLVAVF